MRRPALSTVLLAGAALVFLALAVPLYLSGISPAQFPAYLADEPAYLVDRYSGSRIAAAIVLGGLGVVLAVAAVGRVLRAATAAPADAAPADRGAAMVQV